MAGFQIRQAVPADVEQVAAFHQENSGEYVWPRTIEQVRELTFDRRLLVASLEGSDELVGMAYVTWDQGTKRWEFGGAFVLPKYRSKGLSSGLARFLLAQLFLTEQPQPDDVAAWQLIAHVHEDNQGAVRYLLPRLGFVHDDEQEEIPGEVAPDTMKRNAHGNVVGDLFRYDRDEIRSLARWMKEFKATRYDVKLEWFDDNVETAEDLVEFAKLLGA